MPAETDRDRGHAEHAGKHGHGLVEIGAAERAEPQRRRQRQKQRQQRAMHGAQRRADDPDAVDEQG